MGVKIKECEEQSREKDEVKIFLSPSDTMAMRGCENYFKLDMIQTII